MMETRFFKIILEFIRWSLIVLSIVAIVLSISVAIKSPSFHDRLYHDFIDFIGFFQPFTVLFAATFVVISMGFVMRQFKK